MEPPLSPFDDTSLAVAANKEGYRFALARFLLPAAVFVWPFLYFLPRVWTFGGRYASIGNDFEGLYYNYKVWLLDHLSQGRIPMWSPAEGAGFPFYSNPFAQAFYPFNVPLAALYVVNGGYTSFDHQRFTVLGVSILALGLFVWLRSLRLPDRAAAFSALVMSVSFKVAEILRFPNAVHTAAWYPWILLAITAAVQRRSTRGKLLAGLQMWLFLVCLLTGGYPYYVYYGLFLFVPYAGLLLVPALGRSLTGAEPERPVASILVMLGAGAASLLACGPYLYRMNALLSQTADRGGGDFEYATFHAFTLLDTLGSMVFPPAAQAEGWYYFGICGLLLILVFTASKGFPLPRLLLLAWVLTISAITYGKDSALFSLLWQYLPLFSRLRVWGRLNIVLVPILAWLLALAYAHFEEIREMAPSGNDHPRRRRALGALVAGYGLVLLAQIILSTGEMYDPYWEEYFSGLASYARVFPWSGATAFLSLLLLLSVRLGRRFEHTAECWVVMSLLVALSAVDMGPVGRRMWEGPNRPEPPRKRLDVALRYRESFSAPRIAGGGTLPLDGRYSVGVVPNWYFERYARFLQFAEAERAPRRRLLGVHGGQRLYFTEQIRHPSVLAFLQDADRFGKALDVLSYDADALAVKVEAPQEGYVSFIDNWDPDWEARVDDRPTPMERLFDTFKSVKVPAGAHQVDFTYRPRLLTRMLGGS